MDKRILLTTAILLTACFSHADEIVIPAEKQPVLRDPFWPVNYQPATEPEPVPEQTEPDGQEGPLAFTGKFSELSAEEQALIKSHLRVAGIIHHKDKDHIAIVNGAVVREGDVLPLTLSNRKYRFLVKKLNTEMILLEPAEEEQSSEPQTKG